MGDTAGGRLARAVSGAGGLGLVGGGYADPAWLERELAEAGDARIGVGFISWALAERAGTLRLALEARPVAVQLGFGDPRPFADDVRAAGAVLLCGVQTDEDVQLALEAGADALVAQGQDGGGHGRPFRSTMGLVPSLVDRVAPLPVVAAGGIVDGRGLAAALLLGAAGASLGTAFFATDEAIANDSERAGLVAGRAQDTLRTEAVDRIRGPRWPDGFDGRIVRNQLSDRWDDARGDAEAVSRLQEDFRASAPDDYRMRPLWAGEGLDLVTRIRPAADVVAELAAGTVATLRSAGQLLTDD
jgi:nitronate monooxygenase